MIEILLSVACGVAINRIFVSLARAWRFGFGRVDRMLHAAAAVESADPAKPGAVKILTFRFNADRTATVTYAAVVSHEVNAHASLSLDSDGFEAVFDRAVSGIHAGLAIASIPGFVVPANPSDN